MGEADPVAALVAFLLRQNSVIALAGADIFGGELPQDVVQLMPRAAILVKPSGGASMMAGSFADHDTQRVDIITYGPTPFVAHRLMAEVAHALRQLRRQVHANTLIHWCESAGGFMTGREAQTEWPRVWRSFQIFHALTQVEN